MSRILVSVFLVSCWVGCSDDTTTKKDAAISQSDGPTVDIAADKSSVVDTAAPKPDVGKDIVTIPDGPVKNNCHPFPTTTLDVDQTFAKLAGTWEGTRSEPNCTKGSQPNYIFSRGKKYTVKVTSKPNTLVYTTDLGTWTYVFDGKDGDSACAPPLSTKGIIDINSPTTPYASTRFVIDGTNAVDATLWKTVKRVQFQANCKLSPLTKK